MSFGYVPDGKLARKIGDTSKNSAFAGLCWQTTQSLGARALRTSCKMSPQLNEFRELDRLFSDQFVGIDVIAVESYVVVLDVPEKRFAGVSFGETVRE
jgi:hypothetical protein